MKKRTFIIAGVFVLLLINFVLAADVAYVLKKVNRVDQGFLDAFSDLGLDVDLIEDKEIKETDFSDYDIVFISDTRLRNVAGIPDMPVIVANKFYAKLFGFLDKGRASKLVSNSKLKVNKNGEVVKVYEKARFKTGGVSIPYYYLPNRYKNGDLETAGTTFTRKSRELGDVVAYLEDRKCFFGITKTKYWTDDAKEMFDNCVKFALGIEVGEGAHDVLIDDTLTNTVNGIRIKDVDANEFLLDDTAELMCDKKYKVDFRTRNIGDFTEDVDISGELASFTWTAKKTGLAPGKTSTTGSKTITIDFDNGFYDLEIMVDIGFDDNPSDNFKSRRVKVVC